ncbi:MAG: hypothetical protein GY715_11050 [Planctomycetes bacterium]|nr:hypothetical protein [Planctomycetota bacterium]
MRTPLILIVLGALLPACATPEPAAEAGWPAGTAQVEHTPLTVDPMEPNELAGWWSNGEEMLRLDAPGSYARFATTNRYDGVIERGLWTNDRYFELHLVPYDAKVRERTRVGIVMRDGRLALLLPGRPALRALPGPPLVAEDELLGRWAAPAGSLELRDDGRYAWALPDLPQATVIIVGHEGRWRLAGDRLVLDPDAPNMPSLTFRRSGGGEQMRLRSGDTEFRPAPDEHVAEGPGGVG